MRLLNNFYHIEQFIPGENEARFVVSFHADSQIYQAHFPGQPITPGVCIIETARELLEEYLEAEMELCHVKNIKFLAVIIPEEGNTFTYGFTKLQTAEELTKLQVTVTSGDIVYAKMSFTCKKR